VFTSAKYVLSENYQNFHRIVSIAKYELLADMRESKLGVFWNFANPAIHVLTYWFVFGYVFNRKAVDDIPYIVWMLGGMVVWFFISPCITDGCNSVYRKVNVITKMKFPVSILPMTVVLEKLFDHCCLFIIMVVIFATQGYYPSVHWFALIYYLFCAIVFSVSLSLTTSVLNMLARDTRKLILACMRLLLYLTPILWNLEKIGHGMVSKIIMCNPIYYLVQGYRDCFFYHRGFAAYSWSMAWFWGITLLLFFFGSYMMYKFKTRFIDMI
jgi:ABC-type polysaccharide/polyol phosphate export systems, permease component